MQAKILIDSGYQIVPINQGKKGPLIKEWQIKDFTAEDIKAGIGVKTGIGDYPLAAVDIDVLDPKLAGDFSAWVQDTFGPTVERVGNAPKTMVIFRAAESGWPKVTSRWYEDNEGRRQRLEILGKGQQFVAYHIHPETGRPYEWVDMFGGLENYPANELPVITADQVEAIVKKFEEMANASGLSLVETSNSTPSVTRSDTDAGDFTAGLKVGLSIAEAAQYLAPLDASDYEQWIRLGMAVYHEFDGSEDAFAVYRDWSATAGNYAGEDETRKKWESFAGRDGITARTLIKLSNDASRKDQREAKRQALDEYKKSIASAGDIYDLTDDVLTSIGQKIDVNDVVAVRTIVDAAADKAKDLGVALTRTEINKKLGVKAERSESDGEDDARERTEIGNARRMVADNKDKIMFVTQTEDWYLWAGNYWKKVTSTDIEALAKETMDNQADALLEFGAVDKKEYYAYVQKALSARNIMAMVRMARSEDDVRVNIYDLNKNKDLFAVANGAIDLTTGVLLPSNPLDRLTIASDVEFDPSATCPVFDQTINDIFEGDKDMVEYMARWFGHQMLGDPKEDKIGIFFGCGANGKSTLTNIIRDVFGDHAKTADSSTFLGNGAGNGSGGPREDILRLQGARMVTVTEPNENSVLKEGLIKAMTGGEAMPARGAYAKHTIEVMPTWVTNMATNHKPIVKGTDHGIWRRLMLIEFGRNFDKDPSVTKDVNRSAKLQGEKPGILAWLVRGCLDYQKQGLNPPKKVLDATAEYRDDMDLLSEFLDERCIVGPKEVATNTELWTAWKLFAEERGELGFVSSARALGRRLSSHGFEAIQRSYGLPGRGYLGLSVRSIFDTQAAIEKAERDEVPF